MAEPRTDAQGDGRATGHDDGHRRPRRHGAVGGRARLIPATGSASGVGSTRCCRAADVVTVCCPLTKETRGLFDDAAFEAMKPGAYIINVTRGPIIDLDAITKAMQSGKLGGAGLDVHPVEPLPEDHVLWTMPNTVITPHTAGASQFRARRNVGRFIANLRHWGATGSRWRAR